MSEQDKGSKHIGQQVEFKEGEREPLSCNKANVRSPSLDITNPDLSTEEKRQLDMLAKILVDAFLDSRKNEHRK